MGEAINYSPIRAVLQNRVPTEHTSGDLHPACVGKGDPKEEQELSENGVKSTSY